jgi:hypothetical protein
MFISGPNFFSIPGPESRVKKVPDPESGAKILTQEMFLSSQKHDPGCSSRIRILIFNPSRIPDPGVKKAPDPGTLVESIPKIFYMGPHWVDCREQYTEEASSTVTHHFKIPPTPSATRDQDQSFGYESA